MPSLIDIKPDGPSPTQKISDFTRTGSVGIANVHFADVGTAINFRSFIGEFTMSGPGIAFIQSAHTPSSSEIEFEEQKRLFEQIPPLLLEPYRSLFVISHNGRILDADRDLDALTSRFFAEHRDMAVCVAKIGGELREIV